MDSTDMPVVNGFRENVAPVSAERQLSLQVPLQEWCQQQWGSTRPGTIQNSSMSSNPSPRWDSLGYDESVGWLQGFCPLPMKRI